MKRFLPFVFVLLVILTASCKSTPVRNEYMTADIDPIEVGTINAGVPEMFTGRIRQVEILLIYYPRIDTVVFQFPYQYVTYREHWNTVNREALLAAISRYQSDFAARNLPAMGRSRMRRAYGTLNSVTEWGLLKSMLNARGRPKVELGYAFEQNSPYFVITQRQTKNELSKSSNATATSLMISLHFTRSMLEDLAAAIEQKRLLSVLPATGSHPSIRSDGELLPDEY
jgi:hypothetical protein